MTDCFGSCKQFLNNGVNKMKMYRVTYRHSATELQALEVIKETPATVTYLEEGFRRTYESRQSKQSSGISWFDNFSDAKKFAVDMAQFKVLSAMKRLTSVTANLERLSNQEDV
jgi:hypothetical protein